MPAYAYLILVAGVVAWFTPFVPAHQKTGPAKVVNRRSRWGVLLQFAAFTLLWQAHFWERSLPGWRTSLSIALFAVAAALSWTSSHALRGQLRIDAGLGAEHKLVRSGPYGMVRHPIYTGSSFWFRSLCSLWGLRFASAPKKSCWRRSSAMNFKMTRAQFRPITRFLVSADATELKPKFRPQETEKRQQGPGKVF